MLNGKKTYLIALIGAVLVVLREQLPEYAGVIDALLPILGFGGLATLRMGVANGKAPKAPPAAAAALLVGALMLTGCTTTNYNIDFHKGAFRVADKMKIDPGQGGDDGSSTTGAPTAGGEEGSPGGSNVLDGFAQQGNIFQIGTAAKAEGEVRSNLQNNSQGDTDQGGSGSTRTGGDTGGDTGSDTGGDTDTEPTE